ncbi:photoreceptor cilium actin regulator [Gouania willdenowi]|uniref:photoreceptor cilium actin regulator n=1 Tax=Gouania willdenowi TaxID=441366 RepID=UPI0010567A1F|nr:photoreceptor cilium actin regulator [Gouania willdenowi]
MGCSPSKGNQFGILGATRRSRMLPPPPQESPKDLQLEERGYYTFPESTKGETKERKPAGQTKIISKETHMTQQKKINVDRNTCKMPNQGAESASAVPKKEKSLEKQDLPEKKLSRKPKKNTKGGKGVKKKDMGKYKSVEQKVDFPEPLVRAHQAAYAFLNPSINKYDSLLGLLDQATDTQHSVQPMVAFIALRYEEIIQQLEEMADEGENVLKENREHLAWPSQMENLSSSSLKSGSATTEVPPDLLQQLLQYTTQRMQNMSQAVSKIADSALEDAVEYFASVSEILEEKLKVKRAVETRLMNLLTFIEIASLRKPGPEDSALFSEDSGIGAESESLAGSERNLRRESCGSTGTNRTTPVSMMGYNSLNNRQRISRHQIHQHRSQISPSVSLTSLNSINSTCTLMADGQRDSLLGSVSLDADEDCDDEADGSMIGVEVEFRKRSNSSPVNSKLQPSHRLPSKRIENPQNVEMTLKMKNAISSKIQFVPLKNTNAKSKVTGSQKSSTQEWTDDQVNSPKRPQSAAPVHRACVKKAVTRQQRSRSAESLRSKGEDPTLLELERTQNDLNQRMQKMSKSKIGAKTKVCLSKQKQGTLHSPLMNRKKPLVNKISNAPLLPDQAHNSKGNDKNKEVLNKEEENIYKHSPTPKVPMKAIHTPSPPVSPKPSCGIQRGRNSVKKLIDTFSQGIGEQEGAKVLGPLKGVRKCGVPVLPGLGNVEAVLSAGIISCRLDGMSSEKSDYLELESLPPPPLEVLMDNSFERLQNISTEAADVASNLRKSPLLKRAVVSQRLRASFQSVPVLPSRGGVPQALRVILPVRTDQQDNCAQSKISHPDMEPGVENNLFYHQAKNITQQRNVFDTTSTMKQTESTDMQDSGNLSVPSPIPTGPTVPPTTTATDQTAATPPASRVRMLPLTPNSPHKRLHSPSKSKNLSTPPATPSVNRRLPSPPAIHRKFPSPLASKQNNTNSNSAAPYPFKAPSPPASPKIQRLSRENSSEDSSSARKVSNARSVFCPASPSMFETQPYSAPELPHAWTSSRVSFLSKTWAGRGSLPVFIQGPQPFIRRSQSDRRQSLGLPPRSQGISVAATCGSEPAICSQGLDDEPIGDDEQWGSQSDFRVATRSASHPDLCVVGKALHRD